MRGTAYTNGVNLPSVGSDLNWRVIATGDFSLEGQVDLLLTNYATGQNVVWIMDGVTYSGNAATLPLDYEADWRSTTTGDFDQDGQPDIVKSNYATGENAIWLMDGFAYQGAGPLPTYTNFYTNPAASTNTLTFIGREDDGTGILYYRARYYSPRLQRFISEDPLGFGGGSNLYRYVSNAPNTKTDPLGLTDGSGGGSDDEGDIDTLSDINVTAPRNGGGFGGFGDATPSFSGAGSFPRQACVFCLVPAAGQMAVDLFAVGLGLWLQRGGPTNISTDTPEDDKNSFPDRKLLRDEKGNPVPDKDTEGPHTQLGRNVERNGKYNQAREFDKDGKPVRDIDFTDHGRPQNHLDPHQHRYVPNQTGGTPMHGPMEGLP